MDTEEHKDLVETLAEAASIVDEAMGTSLTLSGAREHILVHLTGALVGDWFDRRRGKGPPPAFMGALAEATAGIGEASKVAMQLTSEMILNSPGKARKREWVWETYSFFLGKGLGEGEENGGNA